MPVAFYLQPAPVRSSPARLDVVESLYLMNFSFCNRRAELEDKDNNIKIPTVPSKPGAEPEVVLRRTHSFETDEK